MRYNLGEPVAALWTDTELTRLANDAQRQIANLTGGYEEVQTLTTTASSRTVAFEGHKVNAVEYIPGSGNRQGLQRITPKMLGHLSVNGITPQYYFTWGHLVVIEPKPTTAYTLYAYVSRWPDYHMADTTDEPIIPTEFHALILDYALSLAWLKAKKYGTAGAHYRQFVVGAMEAMAQYQMRRRDYNVDIRIPDVVQIQEGRG
jgi:hypothetical protein